MKFIGKIVTLLMVLALIGGIAVWVLSTQISVGH